MKFAEALRQFKYALLEEYDIKRPIIKIVVSKRVIDGMIKDFNESKDEYRFSDMPMHFGPFETCGVRIEEEKETPSF